MITNTDTSPSPASPRVQLTREPAKESHDRSVQLDLEAQLELEAQLDPEPQLDQEAQKNSSQIEQTAQREGIAERREISAAGEKERNRLSKQRCS